MSPIAVRGLVMLGALLVLASVNRAIFAKERIIRDGEVIYLELAPVDPRSLMQGDYMALRFKIAAAIRSKDSSPPAADLSVPLQLDARRVATLGTSADPARLRYRIRNREVWLGTNAYFFEEGSAERYASAAFGEFRLDRDSGEAVLVGLRDSTLRRL